MSVAVEFNREQFINVFNILRMALVRDKEVQAQIDTLIRASSIPLVRGAQIAVLLLDENRSNLLGALLVRIGEGGIPRIPDGIESMITMDLNLENQGNTLKDVCKAGTAREAAKIASQIIESKYGKLWTTILLDVEKVKELFDAVYPIGMTVDLLGKSVRMGLDKCSKDEIVFEPVPGFLATLQKIFGLES